MYENSQNNIPKFKTIDGDDNDFMRKEMPSYHGFPRQYVQPVQYSTQLKRSMDQTKMEEIFGTKQNMSNYEEVKFDELDRAKYNVSITPVSSINIDQYRFKIYKAINDYFPEFVFTKVKESGKYSIWKSLVSCMICIGQRYLIAITINDRQDIGARLPLESLHWESFQTRWSENDPDIQNFNLQTYKHNKVHNTTLNDIIKLTRQNKKTYMYECNNLPIIVEIIKQSENENLSETGTVISALDLFQTVISFPGN